MAAADELPRYIYLSGPDGVGKTYHTNQIESYLRDQGYTYSRVWLRFYHLFSLPLLALARLTGHTGLITDSEGNEFSVHRFEDSILLSRLYPLLLFFDTALYILYTRLSLARSSPDGVIFDRFVYDTICQAMVSTGRDDIPHTLSAQLFHKLLPEETQVVILVADEETLRERRSDVEVDPTLSRKLDCFKLLADEFDLPTINTAREKAVVEEEISNAIL